MTDIIDHNTPLYRVPRGTLIRYRGVLYESTYDIEMDVSAYKSRAPGGCQDFFAKAREWSDANYLQPATSSVKPLIYRNADGWRIPTEIEAMVGIRSHPILRNPPRWVISSEIGPASDHGVFQKCEEYWVDFAPLIEESRGGSVEIQSVPLGISVIVEDGKVRQVASDHLMDILHTWESESIIYNGEGWSRNGRPTTRLPFPIECGLLGDQEISRITLKCIGEGRTILPGTPAIIL